MKKKKKEKNDKFHQVACWSTWTFISHEAQNFSKLSWCEQKVTQKKRQLWQDDFTNVKRYISREYLDVIGQKKKEILHIHQLREYCHICWQNWAHKRKKKTFTFEREYKMMITEENQCFLQ